jgi:hypothetical protein
MTQAPAKRKREEATADDKQRQLFTAQLRRLEAVQAEDSNNETRTQRAGAIWDLKVAIAELN